MDEFKHFINTEFFNKKISLLAWVGLMIDLAMLVAACYISTSLIEVLDELSYSDQHLYRITSLMVPLFSFAIVTQIVSLPVMLKKPKTGFTLASIGSFVMLPLSMFFISCCLVSSENYRNKKPE